jgi:fructokinase
MRVECARMRIGIDLGGSKIEGIFLGNQGQTLARRRVATPAGSYADTLSAIRDLVAILEAEAGVRGTVGIGMPGAISPKTGLVKNANSTWLNDRPLDRDLAAMLGRPVRLANDADCFALSEATDGTGRDAPIVFGAILGTGVGGGIVVNGALLKGADAIAGEWGHNPLPWPTPAETPGPPCYCGKTGCIETFLSGPGLTRDHGGGLSGAEVAARADAGDASAQAALTRYADRLARGLASVINILDPTVIVLGGGLSKMTALYDRVPPLLAKYVFSDQVAARLLPPRHGDASGVRGAAWLW